MSRAPSTLTNLAERYPGSAHAITALMKAVSTYVTDEDVAAVVLTHVAHIVKAVEREASRAPRKRAKAPESKPITMSRDRKLAKCGPRLPTP